MSPSPQTQIGVAFGFGVLGTALSTLGYVIDRRQCLLSHLTALTFVLTTVAGALIFLSIVRVMNATWPIVLHRLCEAIVSVLPLLAVLFIPIAFGVVWVYPWANSRATLSQAVATAVEHQRPFLNARGFQWRSALYFAIWIGIAIGQRRLGRSTKRLSAASLPVLGFTLTLAAVDWWMSLSAGWYSTMFGVYVFAGGFLAALALLTLLVFWVDRAGRLPVNESHYYALGRLLFAFVIFWAYIAYFQVFLIWIADKPSEVTYYLARHTGPWKAVGAVLLFGHFALPFFLLLSYRAKRSPVLLAAVSVWLLAMHYVDVAWLVLPDARPRGFPFRWTDVAALFGVVGLSATLALFLARRRRLLPIADPGLAAALRYRSP